MSILYSLIAKNIDIVLCEYTECTGNFQQISRILLRTVKRNSKLTINYSQYKFHYINENDITYLCLSEGYNDELSFAFLKDVKKAFLSKYDYEKIASFSSYQLSEFEKVFSQLMNYYKRAPKITKTGDVIRDLNETKAINCIDVDTLLGNNQVINLIVSTNSSINSQTKNINIIVNEISRQKRKKQLRNFGIFGCTAIIFIYIIYKFYNN